MSFRRRAERFLTTSRGGLSLGTNLALLVIMFAVSLDAVLRYAFSAPIAGVLEGVELLLVFAVFGSVAQVQADRGHIAISALTELLGRRSQAAVKIIVSLLGLGLFGVMTWATGAMAWRSWRMGEYSDGLIAFPIYPSRIMVALGCLFLSLQLLSELASAIEEFADRSGKPA